MGTCLCVKPLCNLCRTLEFAFWLGVDFDSLQLSFKLAATLSHNQICRLCRRFFALVTNAAFLRGLAPLTGHKAIHFFEAPPEVSDIAEAPSVGNFAYTSMSL